MPLLSKLTDKLGDMMKEKLEGKGHGNESSHDSRDDHESHYDQQRAYYGQQEPHSDYSQPQYGHQQPYGSQPPLPPGWIQQWDANSQRYFYVEQATGRTQWEPPIGYPGADMHGQQYGYGHSSYGDEQYRGSHHGESEQKSSNTGLALAGGAALGAVGGAWAMHEYNEHQEEEAAAAAAAAQPTTAIPGDDTIYVPAEAAGSDVESAAEDVASEREDVAEAQEELAEASSESDREEALEELEEEQEELEEANEDLEEEIEDE